MDKSKNIEFIDINILGKCLKKKTFRIKLNAEVELVKKLILARIIKNKKTIITKVDKCYLLTDENIKLDNKKTIKYYYNNSMIENKCNLYLKIKLKCCLENSNEYEFGRINVAKKKKISKDYKLPITNIVRSISTLENEEIGEIGETKESKKEGWYDNLSWDDTPINDDEWE